MKRIIYSVVAAHLVMILWMTFWSPQKKEVHKSLKVRTVVQAPPPPPKQTVVAKATVSPPKPMQTPLKKKPAAPPAPAKKAITTPKPTKKVVPISQELQKQLQESIEKFSENSHKECPKAAIEVPKQITHLKVDSESLGEENTFAARLIECLQQTLNLPEKGAVKVELALKQDGSFVKMQILDAKSQRNAFFLEEQLPMISYPRFTGSLKQEKEHTFVISFCDF